MNKVQLTIIGLGQIGASIGLGLVKNADQIQRVGHDKAGDVLRQAQKVGAIEQIQTNLHAAVEKADVVVLAIPVDQIQTTLQLIAPDLKSGVVVLDCSPVNTAVLKWAKDLLKPERYFLKFVPTLNPFYLLDTQGGLGAAHSDAFQNGVIFISGSGGTDPDALKLASDLTALLGAKPLFSDPVEVDGLLAAQSLLPKLTAAAVVNSTIDEPGWIEGRKATGNAYAMISEPLLHLDEIEKMGLSAILNKENATRVIDNLVNELLNLRDAIENDDQETLHSRLNHAVEGRQIWWEQRNKADWSNEPALSPIPTSGQWLGRLVGMPSRSQDKKSPKK